MTDINNHKGPEDGYEIKDVNPLKVFGYFAAGTIIIVVLLVFLIDFFTATREEMIYEAVLKPESVTLRELRAREEQELGSYGILDEEQRVYRIPINRAMEIMANEAYEESRKSGNAAKKK